MKKSSVLTVAAILLVSVSFCAVNQANAFPTQAYISLYLTTGNIAIHPDGVINLGDLGTGIDFALLETISRSFVPDPIIGLDGYFVTLLGSSLGYCDSSVLIRGYINSSSNPVISVGIGLFSSNAYISKNGTVLKKYLASKQVITNPDDKQPLDWKDYLVNPSRQLPTAADLESLIPTLEEARTLYPEYEAAIDLALGMISSLGKK